MGDAFAAYERLRRDRAARINHTKTPGPMARMLMPLLMPLAVKSVMNPDKTLATEQRCVIDWDAPVSLAPALC
ncbi:hypothetical protein AB0K60_32205 [Thermopolyspora sp. NPDC052614]|uniref:hypothetical protein n=1 Tax=Thermopolyspora sp. NPDC052614 TaxID=3155682 RepID=UPI00343EFB12